MKKRLLLLLACTGLAMPAFAAESSTNAAPSGNRFLFIVDTSSLMKRMAEPTRDHLFDLIFTGLDGQMNSGDTFGLWTFDESTFTDFQVQLWNPLTSFGSANAAATFLNVQRYDKPPNLEQVLRKASSVIRSAKDVTLLIFSDGSKAIQGTPFDEQINDVYLRETRFNRQALLPFVTVLAARAGQIEGWRVSAPGEAIELPRLPPLNVAEASQRAASEPPKTNAPPTAEKTSTAQPLIEPLAPSTTVATATNQDASTTPQKLKVVREIKTVSKPPAEQSSPEKTVVPDATTNVAPAQVLAPAVTNTPATIVEAKPVVEAVPTNVEEPKQPAAAPTASVTSKPSNVTEQAQGVSSPTATAPEAKPPASPPESVVAKTEPKTSAPADVRSTPLPERPAPSVAPATEPVVARAESKASTPVDVRSTRPAPSAVLVTEPVVARTEPKASAPADLAATPPPEKKLDQPARSAAEAKTVSDAPPITKTDAAKPNLALVTPENQFGPTTLLIAGLALLFVAGLLCWMLVRRTRGATQPSLISESMDQHRK
jgi:hypothetical protein